MISNAFQMIFRCLLYGFHLVFLEKNEFLFDMLLMFYVILLGDDVYRNAGEQHLASLRTDWHPSISKLGVPTSQTKHINVEHHAWVS